MRLWYAPHGYQSEYAREIGIVESKIDKNKEINTGGSLETGNVNKVNNMKVKKSMLNSWI